MDDHAMVRIDLNRCEELGFKDLNACERAFARLAQLPGGRELLASLGIVR